MTPNADVLTPRELQVVELLGKGKSTRQISAALSITANTVKEYIRRISDKLGVRGRHAIAVWSWRVGIVSPEDRAA